MNDCTIHSVSRALLIHCLFRVVDTKMEALIRLYQTLVGSHSILEECINLLTMKGHLITGKLNFLLLSFEQFSIHITVNYVSLCLSFKTGILEALYVCTCMCNKGFVCSNE